jgi:CheY-like chemotaxis protein/anti-sigma regulatory factor (Ser/Thr protein kinase)
VLVNLVVNAQQALLEVAPPRRLAVRAREAGAEVVVEVEDNGPGMPPEVARRAFEPFFTTKPQGVGTGIGLSVCHGIVAAHGGRIEVESRGEGAAGTTFRVTLPVAPADGGSGDGDGAAPEPAAGQAPAPAAAPAARGRVLVVDDEPEIAELVAETLRREEGLEVDTAPSGRRALARLERGGIDVVVSDLRMPDLDGAALTEALRARHPALDGRLVLMTGDALRAETGEAAAAVMPRVPVLEKPLDLAALRRVVRRLLDGEAAEGG